MTNSAPFPWFGGKRRAAPLAWAALGDPGGYVEPFAGSAAVLLARPPFKGRRVETLNDADGWLVNAWRAIRSRPAEVAEHAAWPVTEVDYHARLAWLQERRTDGLVSWLEGDPEVCDPKAAGWWLYVLACGIGDPFGPGPWRVIDGRLVDTRAAAPRQRGPGGTPGDDGINRELPHLGNAGQGVLRALPHLGDAGQGVLAYLQRLAARLERVRITCGDWTRVVQPSVTRATAGNNVTALFIDPPYTTSGDLYAARSDTDALNAAVREWCRVNGEQHRIVLCGYAGDHDILLAHGWRVEHGRAGGGAGYNTDALAGRRERLWMSPACIDPAQLHLDFGEVTA